MLPSHHRAMADIEQCRTEALGGHVYLCDDCEEYVYSYHSCQNRHCPQCGGDAGQRWLERQQQMLLPVPYFMVTFTLPQELRAVARSHQRVIYNLLFRTAAAALQQLAQAPRFVGGQIGIVGVLHTWGRNLSYHLHVHFLVPGGGLAPDGQTWRPTRRKDFLVHVKPLAKLFRGKFRDKLKKSDLYKLVPKRVWRKKWVVHCQAVGTGETALKYLAPYIFRVAISNQRIVKVENDQVTFRYKPIGSRKNHYCTLPAEVFIHRFLQHVLPKGFVKVRYYGLFSPAYRLVLSLLRLLLTPPAAVTTTTLALDTVPEHTIPCPFCGKPMRRIATLKPRLIRAPPAISASSAIP